MNSKCWYKDVCTNQCISSCPRFIEMEFLFENSGIPEGKRFLEKLDGTYDYDQYIRLQAIKDDILNFVNEGRNLYITSSNTGNGKTTWALKLLMKYFDEVWAGNGLRVRGLYVHVPRLLIELKNFQSPLSEAYKKNLMDCDLVVWDDIAVSTVSTYDYSNLLMFLDARIMNNKSNIFTSNILNPQDMSDVLGPRMASRVFNTSEIIIFKGKDRRHDTVASDK